MSDAFRDANTYTCSICYCFADNSERVIVGKGLDACTAEQRARGKLANELERRKEFLDESKIVGIVTE